MERELWFAIEDNAGGLHLARLVDGGKCDRLFSGFEHGSSNMVEDLEAAANGESDSWDDASEDPENDYRALVANEYGYKIIGEACIGGVSIELDKLGSAGKRWAGPYAKPAKRNRRKSA